MTLAAVAWFGGHGLIVGPAIASEFRTPAVTIVKPDWRAAQDQLRTEINARPEIAGVVTLSGARRLPPGDPRRRPAFIQLNAISSQFFPNIGQSPVPVLVPFDFVEFASNRMIGGPTDLSASHYQAGFRTEMFDAGPAGYDAVFSLDPVVSDDLPHRVFNKPVEVQITGSLLIYDIKDARGGKGEPVKALANQFPDLRRIVREGSVRYAFTRFGVPYVVSIQCLDSVPLRNRLACRDASAVAERFLKTLRINGGGKRRTRPELESVSVSRPTDVSPDFTFRAPGDIITASGYHEQGGRADPTAYAQIRFPMQEAPAYANSQSFLNWGDCNFTGRTASPRSKGGSYRCKRNDKPLVFDESASENYSYPWQDNFCETRGFEVGQCANGFGHQGQDIRPSSCPLRNDGADRCEANRYNVVAARDGVIIRASKQQAALLLVDTPTDHVRFRYMHMNPGQMDSDGVLHGRRVSEGEKIGVVSNFQDYPGGTTTHLHFDLQVFTPDGWLWVNPYVTLVSAYERLLGARGTEIVPEPAVSSAVAHATSDEKTRPGTSAEGGIQ